MVVYQGKLRSKGIHSVTTYDYGKSPSALPTSRNFIYNVEESSNHSIPRVVAKRHIKTPSVYAPTAPGPYPVLWYCPVAKNVEKRPCDANRPPIVHAYLSLEIPEFKVHSAWYTPITPL